jgi:peptidoglycan/LPS O-acetylase OafA/YrhL
MLRRGDSAPSLGFILTMTQAWFPVLDGTMLVAVVPQLQHLWSISVELFFYLLFPLVCLVLIRAVSVWTILSLAAINVALFAAAIYACFRYGKDILQTAVPSLTGNAMPWLTYYSPYLHISQFLAGCFVAMIFMKLTATPVGRGERRFVFVLFWMSVAGLVALPVVLFFQPTLPAYYFTIELAVRLGEVVFFSMILLVVSRHGFARFLSWRAVIVGGECSYSVYLLHPFLIRVAMIGESDAPGVPEFLLRLCLFVAIVTAVAWVAYRVVEAPSRAWIRKTLGTRAPREVLGVG